MTDKEYLTRLVQEKIDRQAELRGLKRTLTELDDSLSASRFGRFFGSTYWLLKRWTTLVLGLGLIVLGVLFIVKPSSITQKGDRFFDHLLIEYKVYFIADFGEEFLDLVDSIRAMEEASVEELLYMLNNHADEYMTDRIYLHLMFFGVFLLFLSVFMLYISRQARKVRIRNTKLNEAEKMTQELSKAFQEVIDEEEQELEKLKAILQQL